MTEQLNIIGKIKEGLEFFRRRNFIDAEITFQHVIEIRPDSFYGWFHLGRTLFYLGKVEEARSAFQRALQVNLELANSWLQTGKFCGESTGYQMEDSCLAGYLFEHERDGDIRKVLAEVFYENRTLVVRDHCFEEKAVSDTGVSGEGETSQVSPSPDTPVSGEGETSQVLIKRRNCHVTTH